VDALAVGAFLALTLRGPDGLSRVARIAGPIAIVATAALTSIAVWRHGFDHGDVVVATLGHTLLAVCFGSLLVAALVTSRRDLLGRCLRSRVLRFFGQYSYALYVFQYPLPFLKPSFLSFATLPTLYGSQLPALALYMILGILVATGLALLSWHACEKHFLKLKRFFPYQSSETAARPAHQGQLSLVSPL
jgi:peptidoglycan/LPS O-acetylase OafA/YrhL